jgi:hypothetical protein
LGNFFDPDDGSDMFLRNVGWLSTDSTALYVSQKTELDLILLQKKTKLTFARRLGSTNLQNFPTVAVPLTRLARLPAVLQDLATHTV